MRLGSGGPKRRVVIANHRARPEAAGPMFAMGLRPFVAPRSDLNSDVTFNAMFFDRRSLLKNNR